MKLENIANQVYLVAINEAKLKSHEYVTPEHFLFSVLMFDIGKEIIERSGGNVTAIMDDLLAFFEDNFEKGTHEIPIETIQFSRMLELAAMQASNSSKNVVSLGDLIASIFNLKDSYANYLMQKNGVSRLQLLKVISHDIKTIRSKPKEAAVKSRNLEYIKLYTVNLTEKARLGRLDPLIGREDILNRTIQVLCRRTKNNPLHIGDPGVGKTAIVEGLAGRIVEGGIPYILKNTNVYYLDMGLIVAGTKYRGDFEERLLKILDIIAKEENAVIYLDEIHTLVGTGAVGSSALDAAGILKPYLTNGRIKFIGATTYDDYKKYIEKDRALSRRFQKIDVSEPTLEDTEKILLGLKERYENFHNVEYPQEVVKNICLLSSKYLQDRFMPDKAIDVLDETGAFVRMNAAHKNAIRICSADIERTVAMMAKIPEKTISNSEKENLRDLKKNLKGQIFGQDKAVETVVNAIRSSRAGLSEESKPVANLLFVGPTGVGKTELSKKLAEFLSVKFIRFDMSEYQEKHSVAKLIGSPPGYVGFDEGSMLCETIKKSPYCVLLLDEIEKAHQDILNVLLQIMDYGTLTDNIGRKADFRNVILIMTSNAGAREIGKNIIGFDEKKVNFDAVDKEVTKTFSPEFRNRLDEIVVFKHIGEEISGLIVKKSVAALEEKLSGKNVRLKVSGAAVNWIAENGVSQIYGAREINRLVDREIKKKLVDEILFGKLQNGGTASVDIKSGKIFISIRRNQKANFSL